MGYILGEEIGDNMVDFSILCHHQRVGSTFLQNCIDSHSEIVGIDECFVNMARNPSIRKSGFVPFVRSGINMPGNYIENVIIKTHKDKKAICMKLAYHQILNHNGLLPYIEGNKIPIILLMRRNLVKQVISYMTMARTNHEPINITPIDMFYEVKKAKDENVYWNSRLCNQIGLVLYYEDIIGETIEDRTYLSPLANKAVCNFFGVKEYMMYSTTKKKNKENISVYLPNYDNIKKRFKGTEFEWMMEE